jgi:hypothetical protein
MVWCLQSKRKGENCGMCHLWYACWISRDIVTEFPNPPIIWFPILQHQKKIDYQTKIAEFSPNWRNRAKIRNDKDTNSKMQDSAIPVTAGRYRRWSSCTVWRADGSAPAERGRGSRGCCRPAGPGATSPPSFPGLEITSSISLLPQTRADTNHDLNEPLFLSDSKNPDVFLLIARRTKDFEYNLAGTTRASISQQSSRYFARRWTNTNQPSQLSWTELTLVQLFSTNEHEIQQPAMQWPVASDAFVRAAKYLKTFPTRTKSRNQRKNPLTPGFDQFYSNVRCGKPISVVK